MKFEQKFDDKIIKEYLSKLDFEFFLKNSYNFVKYKKEQIEEIYNSYNHNSKKLKEIQNNNKKQFNFYIENKIRKSFYGGFLLSHFDINPDIIESEILDFKGVGEEWAYFDYWKKYYRMEILKDKVWLYLTRLGAILGIVMTILKIFEIFN